MSKISRKYYRRRAADNSRSCGIADFPHVPLQRDGIIIASIMPLVPGMGFVNAIRDIADSDFLSGTVRMIDALLVFVYIGDRRGGITLGIYANMAGGVLG